MSTYPEMRFDAGKLECWYQGRCVFEATAKAGDQAKVTADSTWVRFFINHVLIHKVRA